jgi:hypothetical protein
MNIARLIPVYLSFLVLGAHFYRAGQLWLVTLCLAMLVLPSLRRKWVPPVMQTALILGALEWAYTLYVIAQIRITHGMPWTRLSIILGAVALFTAASAFVFLNQKLQNRYTESKK